MEIGDRIQCWTHDEMVKKIYTYAKDGIMVDEVKGRENCLEVTEIRSIDDGNISNTN